MWTSLEGHYLPTIPHQVLPNDCALLDSDPHLAAGNAQLPANICVYIWIPWEELEQRNDLAWCF